jgi:predicted dithiol-disulfide oxidoreductase (DUF899 family)
MDKATQNRTIDQQREAALEALAAHPVVGREEWNEARLALMKREKQLMKLNDELTAEKRALPWVKVEKQYFFNSRKGKVSLSDLFEGRSQLFVKHFMMGPQQDWQCPGCSLEVDHVAQLLEHFEHHDMSYVAIARAPLDEIEVVRKKMNWHFNWVSSGQSDFNYDFHVSFSPEQIAAGSAIYNFTAFNPGSTTDLSGDSVFYKNANGEIFHTYGTFGRGGEQFLGIYAFFDVLPKGREEYGPTHALPDWAKPHDTYGR